MKVALIVGHSKDSQGAVNKTSQLTEYLYNKQLAYLIASNADFDTSVVYRTDGYKRLPEIVNDTKADIAISLHCNAFNTVASGTETLTSGTTKSKLLAESIHKEILKVFKLKDRGVKTKEQKDRGGWILHKTSMPCVLLEPFFIDNDTDYNVGINNMSEYAESIIKGINNYLLDIKQ